MLTHSHANTHTHTHTHKHTHTNTFSQRHQMGLGRTDFPKRPVQTPGESSSFYLKLCFFIHTPPFSPLSLHLSLPLTPSLSLSLFLLYSFFSLLSLSLSLYRSPLSL